MLEIHCMPGHLIRRLHQISTSVFAERMEQHDFDFTPIQFAALSGVAGQPGIDQSTLAGLIACDRVTTGGVLDRLQQKGLIRRDICKQDRRARTIHVTEAGEALLDQVKPLVEELQRDILIGLSEAECAILLELLSKATENGNLLSRAPFKRKTEKVADKKDKHAT